MPSNGGKNTKRRTAIRIASQQGQHGKLWQTAQPIDNRGRRIRRQDRIGGFVGCHHARAARPLGGAALTSPAFTRVEQLIRLSEPHRTAATGSAARAAGSRAAAQREVIAGCTRLCAMRVMNGHAVAAGPAC